MTLQYRIFLFTYGTKYLVAAKRRFSFTVWWFSLYQEINWHSCVYFLLLFKFIECYFILAFDWIWRCSKLLPFRWFKYREKKFLEYFHRIMSEETQLLSSGKTIYQNIYKVRHWICNLCTKYFKCYHIISYSVLYKTPEAILNVITSLQMMSIP